MELDTQGNLNGASRATVEVRGVASEAGRQWGGGRRTLEVVLGDEGAQAALEWQGLQAKSGATESPELGARDPVPELWERGGQCGVRFSHPHSHRRTS